MKKDKILIIVVIVALVIIGIVGGSYAYLRVEKKGSDQNISIANFGLVIKQDMKAITLDKEVPKSDEEGLKNSPNTFIIKNEGDVTAKYQVSLIDTTPASTMSNLDIRYRLKRTRSTASSNPETLDVKSLELNGLLDEGVIAPSEEITYELIIWINHDANPNGLTFKKVLSLEGFQADTQDTSGANPPEMLPNMIPVYYEQKSTTDGVWKVADVTNQDKTHQWYDYNNFMWANAVTVKESNGTLNDDGSMTFDGVDDYLELGHGDYDFKDKISAVVRLKIIGTNSLSSADTAIIGNAEGSGFTFNINPNNMKITFNVNINGTYYSTETINSLKTNIWYTIIGVYDGTKLKLFLYSPEEKSEMVSIDLTGKIRISPVPIMLSANVDTAPNYHLAGFSNITISDAFVYTDALTEDEVSKYFSGEITDYPKDNLLVEKTKFNELDTRQKYLEASAGTEVKMEDISSMWVWIPRYKYTIFNGNNETSEEQKINVEFERGIETTGTVSCRDDILTDDNSDHSEICEDKTNKEIKNGISTYTHPAFTFGEEELVGFWFAKFEMSTDDSNCLTSQHHSACDKVGLNVLVKPNETAYALMSMSTTFSNIRNMELYGNIHGFPQNTNAKSSNLNGIIENDSNNYDIHMLKSMEWGAVAYLSQSQYGKYGNSLYEGDYRKVYNNAKAYKTGYSNKEGILYNNLTIENSGQGYIGAGASTTGTIYGVYDMVGCSWEKAMGMMITKDNQFDISNTNWTLENKPLEKYYNVYSYGTSSNQFNRGKLGDATKEILNFDLSHEFIQLSRPWFIYGSRATNGSATVFTFSATSSAAIDNQSSRPVLTITREFPWKDN